MNERHFEDLNDEPDIFDEGSDETYPPASAVDRPIADNPEIIDETGNEEYPHAGDVNRSVDNTPALASLLEQTPTGSGTIPNADSLVDVHTHPAQAAGSPVDENSSQVGLPPSPAHPPLPAQAGSPAFKLDSGESQHLRERWKEIQSKFVDDPHQAVRQADMLVSELVDKISRMLTGEHSTLTMLWKQADDISTEDLRILLQRYHSLFNRLLG